MEHRLAGGNEGGDDDSLNSRVKALGNTSATSELAQGLIFSPHEGPAKGGHRQFKHPIKRGRVTVSGKMSHDLPIGTQNSILKQAGLAQ